MSRLLILLFLLGAYAHAQNFTISGTVKDSLSGEDIYGAVIKVKELANVGATTNAYGFYSLSIPEGEYTLIFRASSYTTKEKSIVLKNDIAFNMELSIPQEIQELEEVKVSATKENDNITSTEMSVTKFDPKVIKFVGLSLSD